MTDSPFNSPSVTPAIVNNAVSDIPVDSINLPSKGQLYDANHPLYNEDHVDIRCMTAREEDLLTSAALLKNGTVYEKLMESCLTNKTIDPGSLLICDRNAILIAIRISGYGADIPAKFDCVSCGQQFSETLSLSSLEIIPLGVNPVRPNTNLFSFILPLSKAQIEFKLLTGRDTDEIDKIQAAKKKLGQQVDNYVTLRLLKHIVSVNGNTDATYIAKFITSMRAGDSRALRKYIKEISPDIDTNKKIKCTFCSEEMEVPVPIDRTFFWPD